VDPILILLAVVAAGACVGWSVMRRRRPVPEEDEWTLPPVSGERPATAAGAEAPPRLDRDALVKRPRAFDPSRWDDQHVGGEPGTGEDDADDLPRFFDRDYLRQRERGEAARTEGEPPDGGGSAPTAPEQEALLDAAVPAATEQEAPAMAAPEQGGAAPAASEDGPEAAASEQDGAAPAASDDDPAAERHQR
jgi:hypothetical protein